MQYAMAAEYMPRFCFFYSAVPNSILIFFLFLHFLLKAINTHNSPYLLPFVPLYHLPRTEKQHTHLLLNMCNTSFFSLHLYIFHTPKQHLSHLHFLYYHERSRNFIGPYWRISIHPNIIVVIFQCWRICQITT